MSAPPIPNAKLTTARPRAVIENVSRQHLLARQVPILQQPMLILFCIYFVQPILSALRSRKTLASLLRCIILAEVASGFAHTGINPPNEVAYSGAARDPHVISMRLVTCLTVPNWETQLGTRSSISAPFKKPQLPQEIQSNFSDRAKFLTSIPHYGLSRISTIRHLHGHSSEWMKTWS